MKIERLEWPGGLTIPPALAPLWDRFALWPILTEPRAGSARNVSGDSFFYVLTGQVSIPGSKAIGSDSFGRSSRDQLDMENRGDSPAKVLVIHRQGSQPRPIDPIDVSEVRNLIAEEVTDLLMDATRYKLWQYVDMGKGADVSLYDLREGVAIVCENSPIFWYVIDGQGRIEHDLKADPVDRDNYGFSDSELPLTFTGCLRLLVMTLKL